jgi:spore germination cell wall hydrolase CwlJ-like protein
VKKYIVILTMFLLASCTPPATATTLTVGQEAFCLAQNIYHEARDQSVAGRVAVALVTRNRVLDKRFPNTYCGVVLQGPIRPSWKNNGTWYPVRNRCQFSWWCDGKSDTPRDKNTWADTVTMAVWFLNTKVFDYTDGATFYHAFYVKPGWAKKKIRTGRIEDHIFYKWK